MMATWDHVDDKVLEPDDFQEIKREVAELIGLWQGFASCLGLTPANMREIDLTYRGDPSRCLDGVLEKWLNQDYNYQKFGLPSWRILVTAVDDKTGGRNPALAKKIAQKHPHPYKAAPKETHCSEEIKGQRMPSGNVVGMKTLLNDLARVAHKWYNIGLQLGIPPSELDKIKGDGNEAQRCLSEVLSKWLSITCDAKLRDVTQMLRSNVISEPQLARKIGNNRELADRNLVEKDLKLLVTLLDPVASKWEDVGIQLDLSARDLDNMKKSESNADKCLREMVKKLEMSDERYSVEDLCRALCNSTVAEAVFADRLRKQYTGFGYQYLFD